MNDWLKNGSWMRAGNNSPAHDIRLRGGFYFTTACRRILNVETAQRLKVEAVGLAMRPGEFLYKLEGDAEVCPECAEKVQAR